MGLDFFGTDLHSGFNLLTDDFKTVMQREANLIWWHPPYWSMIQYSGHQWGTEANPWDLSTMDLSDFCEAMIVAMMNIHDATEANGHYGILMGNMRKNGQYFNLSSMVERIAPGRLVDEIIKIQHNCTSDNKRYAGNGKLVRIAHEKLLVFRKDKTQAIYLLHKLMQRANNSVAMTWRASIRRILQASGKQMRLAEIYQAETFAKKPFLQQPKPKHRFSAVFASPNTS